MPDLGSDKTTSVAYPPKSLYDKWRDHADDLDISISYFIISMVEAGRKQVSIDGIATDSMHELRRQRSDLRAELERERQRVDELERQLHRTAYSDVVEFVADHPGASTPEIIQHIANTVPGRVADHLDLLEEDALDHRDDGYYVNNRSEKNESPTHTTESH